MQDLNDKAAVEEAHKYLKNRITLSCALFLKYELKSVLTLTDLKELNGIVNGDKPIGLKREDTVTYKFTKDKKSLQTLSDILLYLTNLREHPD